MNVHPTGLPDVLIIEPKVYGDERGFFYESYNAKEFEQATGLVKTFVQDNHSRSLKGVSARTDPRQTRTRYRWRSA